MREHADEDISIINTMGLLLSKDHILTRARARQTQLSSKVIPHCSNNLSTEWVITNSLLSIRPPICLIEDPTCDLDLPYFFKP